MGKRSRLCLCFILATIVSMMLSTALAGTVNEAEIEYKGSTSGFVYSTALNPAENYVNYYFGGKIKFVVPANTTACSPSVKLGVTYENKEPICTLSNLKPLNIPKKSTKLTYPESGYYYQFTDDPHTYAKANKYRYRYSVSSLTSTITGSYGFMLADGLG